MSKSEPPAGDGKPNSCDPNALESDHLAGNHISPDPLLDFGSFIYPNIEHGHRSGKIEHNIRPGQKEPSVSEEGQRRPPVAELSTPMADGPPSRRPRRGPEELAAAAAERPDWLPEAWRMEFKIRSSGVTAGSIDRYYVEPVTARRFRSKIEVLHFLETGSKRKKRPTTVPDDMPSESPGANKKKKSASRTKDPAAFRFDFKNPPEKVSWCLTDASEDGWSPSIGDGNLPESTKQEWAAVFDRICHS